MHVYILHITWVYMYVCIYLFGIHVVNARFSKQAALASNSRWYSRAVHVLVSEQEVTGIYIYIYIRIYTFMYICIYVCVYMYTDTDTQPGKWMERQMDIERERERQTDRHYSFGPMMVCVEVWCRAGVMKMFRKATPVP